MFISRASRHDLGDLELLMRDNEWELPDLRKGTTFIARDGGVVGCIRLIEVAPNQVIVNDVLVDSSRRGAGVGGRLMQAAMNSRGGTLYLCCHDEHVGFYERFEFGEVPVSELPEHVAAYFEGSGDLHPEEGHVHHFMSAR